MKSSPHSSSANAEDQPKECCNCGGRILVKHSATFYYDDTPAKKHWSRHNECDMSHSPGRG